MSMNFPSNPAMGEEFPFGSYVYKWDGEKWTTDPTMGNGNGTYLPTTGGALTGPLTLYNPSVDLSKINLDTTGGVPSIRLYDADGVISGGFFYHSDIGRVTLINYKTGDELYIDDRGLTGNCNFQGTTFNGGYAKAGLQTRGLSGENNPTLGFLIPDDIGSSFTGASIVADNSTFHFLGNDDVSHTACMASAFTVMTAAGERIDLMETIAELRAEIKMLKGGE